MMIVTVATEGVDNLLPASFKWKADYSGEKVWFGRRCVQFINTNWVSENVPVVEVIAFTLKLACRWWIWAGRPASAGQ